MARRNIRNIVILLFVLTISTPAFATENWMSTTFQYEHVFHGSAVSFCKKQG